MSHLAGKLACRKLNLGCGRDKRPGYINVDLLASQDPDIVADVLDLRGFPSDHFEEIIAQDILEHFKRVDTRRALYEWNRLLVFGGALFIRTTYLNGLIHRLENPQFQSIEGQELLILNLFSNQSCEGDYHLTAFTEPLLRFYLWECGFDDVKLWVRDQWLFECTARKARDFSYDDLVNHGPADAGAFVARAYQEVLFRPPDDGGLAFLREELRQQRLTRRGVALFLLASEERKKYMLARAPAFPRLLGEGRAA